MGELATMMDECTCEECGLTGPIEEFEDETGELVCPACVKKQYGEYLEEQAKKLGAILSSDFTPPDKCTECKYQDTCEIRRLNLSIKCPMDKVGVE